MDMSFIMVKYNTGEYAIVEKGSVLPIPKEASAEDVAFNMHLITFSDEYRDIATRLAWTSDMIKSLTIERETQEESLKQTLEEMFLCGQDLNRYEMVKEFLVSPDQIEKIIGLKRDRPVVIAEKDDEGTQYSLTRSAVVLRGVIYDVLVNHLSEAARMPQEGDLNAALAIENNIEILKNTIRIFTTENRELQATLSDMYPALYDEGKPLTVEEVNAAGITFMSASAYAKRKKQENDPDKTAV